MMPMREGCGRRTRRRPERLPSAERSVTQRIVVCRTVRDGRGHGWIRVVRLPDEPGLSSTPTDPCGLRQQRVSRSHAHGVPLEDHVTIDGG